MPAYVVTCCPCGRFLYFASNLLPEGEFDELSAPTEVMMSVAGDQINCVGCGRRIMMTVVMELQARVVKGADDDNESSGK